MDYSFPRYLAAKKTVDDRALNARVWQMFVQHLPPAAEILEIGAGIGTMVERLRAQGALASARYTVLDEQTANIAEAQRRLRGHDGLTFEVGDVFTFLAQQPDRQWDVLIAHAVLDLFDIESALPKLLRTLRPTGLFYFTINFDGATILEPAIDPVFDTQIETVYHRTMDERVTNGKRSGDSQAGRHLFGHLRQNGAEILEAGASDWVVFAKEGKYEADEASFLHFIVQTLHGALSQRTELDQAHFTKWIATRHIQIDRGELVYIAHQLDFVGRKQKDE